MSEKAEKSKTILVRAETPVLGLLRGATAEFTDSEYLRAVIDKGHLSRVRKADGTGPAPLSDASRAPAAELDDAAANAADAVAAVPQ
jgi:hypothetical protein